MSMRAKVAYLCDQSTRDKNIQKRDLGQLMKERACRMIITSSPHRISAFDLSFLLMKQGMMDHRLASHSSFMGHSWKACIIQNPKDLNPDKIASDLGFYAQLNKQKN
ncbi:hypothetical protein Hanom_Chr15g01347691 [Helianthus anomalus]